MRTAPLLAFALLAALPVAATPAPKSDLVREELKGPVASVTTRILKKGDDEQELVGTATYDRAGNLTGRQQNEVDFIKDAKPERRNATTTIFHSRMGDSVEIYKFDANGNVIETTEYYGIKFTGPPDTITRYKRDARGLTIEQDFLDSNGKVLSISYYKRDAAGNIASEEEAMGDARPPYPHTDYTYVFDSHGNWIKRTEMRTHFPKDDYFYGPEGTLFRAITYYGSPAK